MDYGRHITIHQRDQNDCLYNPDWIQILDLKLKRNHLCNFGRGYREEQFCEIILNLDQWFRRRCHLKDCLSGALVVLVFSGAEPFMQFW